VVVSSAAAASSDGDRLRQLLFGRSGAANTGHEEQNGADSKHKLLPLRPYAQGVSLA
jgi:hypothetical protein